MNRDEGICNLSHVYDPVIQDEVNIKNTFGTGSDRTFSRHSAAGSQQQLPDEADCSSLRNCRHKNVSS